MTRQQLLDAVRAERFGPPGATRAERFTAPAEQLRRRGTSPPPPATPDQRPSTTS